MVCAQDGQLHIGDKLVSVNGVSLKGVTHSMALQLLKKPMELVTFVILREGLQTSGKATSTSTQSTTESPPQNAPIMQDQKVHNEPQSPLPTKHADKLQSEGQPTSPMGSQVDNESKSFEESRESPSVSKDDESTEEQIPEVPCSPPPSPLLEVDHLLDSYVSMPPPSFSPPPPPLPAEDTTPSEEDLSISSIPIVSPPPDLSPRMKKFMEQDLFSTDDHEGTESQEPTRQEISQDTSSKINQVSSPGNDKVTGWDLQSLLEACNDLNTYENDDVVNSEQSSITEVPLVPVASNPNLSSPRLSGLTSETKISKKNDLEKMTERDLAIPVESSTDIHSLTIESGIDYQSGSKVSTSGLSEGDKDLKTLLKGEGGDISKGLKSLTLPPSPFHSKDSSDRKISDDVKPVAGRRVENVPFVITYQKKFRSLGMKVDLSGEGKVIVTEVSSFGLVGKDGNIRYELCKIMNKR